MPQKQLLELTGSVENIVYRNEKNQYTVLELLSGDEMITVVGTLPYVSAGEELKAFGTWTSHPSFGNQFKAEAFERVAPTTASAILKYLSGGAVKGIGPATAARIVREFGENTLEVLEKEPERLSQIKGITKAKAKEISGELQRVYGIRELMLFLGAFGIKPEEAVRVWKVYGPASEESVRENPYCLCDDYIAVDFSTADSIAASMERAQDDHFRVEAGIIYILRHNANNGHTCLPVDKLRPTAANMLGVDPEYIDDALFTLCDNMSLVKETIGDKEFLFLPDLRASEAFAAERLLMMLKYPPQSIIGIDDEIETIERNEKIEYAGKQKEAIRAALEKGLLILTGGPGTGKTTTLNAIIRILKLKGDVVFLAAPTGRAAKRMSEVTGEEAKTIHRMLQVDWDDNDHPVFTRDEGNPLDCDAVIVDELSMVDVGVFEGLLHALPLGCRLVLVGDSDQLPSVGPGNVLGDLISSGLFPTVQLNEIFRQSMESLIVTNAHRIVSGTMPELGKKDNDFFFMPYDDPLMLSHTLTELCVRRLPASYDFSPQTDIQILCPGRKGELGTVNLNKVLRDLINPPSKDKKQTEIFGTVFRDGDKVMQIKNDYNLPWRKDDGTEGEGVFNGDMGVITEVNKGAGAVRVHIDDREVVYDFDKVGSELEHAYAVTVHKSQGNEFNAVIMPLFRSAPQLCYRNLLYTGITRAKKLLIIMGRRSEIEKMVENDRKTKRYTGLCHFLEEYND